MTSLFKKTEPKLITYDPVSPMRKRIAFQNTQGEPTPNGKREVFMRAPPSPEDTQVNKKVDPEKRKRKTSKATTSVLAEIQNQSHKMISWRASPQKPSPEKRKSKDNVAVPTGYISTSIDKCTHWIGGMLTTKPQDIKERTQHQSRKKFGKVSGLKSAKDLARDAGLVFDENISKWDLCHLFSAAAAPFGVGANRSIDNFVSMRSTTNTWMMVAEGVHRELVLKLNIPVTLSVRVALYAPNGKKTRVGEYVRMEISFPGIKDFKIKFPVYHGVCVSTVPKIDDIVAILKSVKRFFKESPSLEGTLIDQLDPKQTAQEVASLVGMDLGLTRDTDFLSHRRQKPLSASTDSSSASTESSSSSEEDKRSSDLSEDSSSGSSEGSSSSDEDKRSSDLSGEDLDQENAKAGRISKKDILFRQDIPLSIEQFIPQRSVSSKVDAATHDEKTIPTVRRFTFGLHKTLF